MNAILLTPPAHVARLDELVAIHTSDSGGYLYNGSSYPDYMDFVAGAPAIDDGIFYMPWVLSTTGPEGVGRLNMGEIVTANYFSLLGVGSSTGRGFSDEDGDPDSPTGTVVISHGMWDRDYARDPAAVGQTLRISNQPFTIIGVAPEGFVGSMPLVQSDLWITWSGAALIRFEFETAERGSRGPFIRARLAPGATLEDAQAQLDVVAARLLEDHPGEWRDNRDQGRKVTATADNWVPAAAQGPANVIAAFLLAGVGAILLIACANVANLTLARATRRSREVALRASLGAGRGRIVRQLLTESLVVGVVGGSAGVLLAYWIVAALPAVIPTFGVQANISVAVDGGVLLFAAMATLATVVAVGLLPALKASRPNLVTALKQGAGTHVGPNRWYELRNLLVSGQIAISLVLLVSAGLFMRGIGVATSTDPGFRPEGAAAISLDLGREGFPDGEVDVLYEEMERRIQALPGVSGATLASRIPLGFSNQGSTFTPAGYERQAGEDVGFNVFFVGPNFFDVLGIDMIRGRAIGAEDVSGGRGVVVVNEALARRFWPEGDALGQRVQANGERQIVGIVETGKYQSVSEDPKGAFFLPIDAIRGSSRVIIARAANGNASSLVPLLRREVLAVTPGISISAAQTVEQYTAGSLLPARIASRLMGISGALGLLLASVGLYGVMAYLVSQRSREVGIRMALGATSSEVTGMIVRHGLGLAGTGTILGLLLAAGTSQALALLPFGVPTFDAIAFFGVAAGTLSVAALASWIPAMKASRVQPAITLRED